ncbi:MAG: carbon-nitrogen hydrolase family protein [Sphingobium sp.]|nr:carbon-nitrogen hydrolase family protein [Sphingobium sp.]
MRAAIVQANSGIDPSANAAMVVDAIAQAKAGGADMVFTPEMVGYLDRDRQRAAMLLRDEAHDEVLAAVREAAALHGLWVHIGSLGLKNERADGRWSNRSFIIDANGDIRARYDKLHLFDVNLPTGESWRESAVYGPGEQLVAVDTPWARIGLSICYDLRFAHLYQRLSDAGATVMLMPAAFTVPTGKAHWEVLLRARAIESGAYVIAPAQCGHHQDGRETYGHSLVVDPWGKVLLDMGEVPGVAFVDIDLAQVNAVRARIPVLDHRRNFNEDVTIR